MLGEGTLGDKVMLLLCRHPGVQSNAVNIQGVFGEGTLVSWFGVLLVMVAGMDVLVCFRADILLEIPRVHVIK